MNTNDLCAEIARRQLTIPKLAKLIGMDKKTLYTRVSGKTDFKQSEIAEIAKILHLSQAQILSIFFGLEVA